MPEDPLSQNDPLPRQDLQLDQTVHFPTLPVRPTRKIFGWIHAKLWRILALQIILALTIVFLFVMALSAIRDGKLVVEITEPDVIVQIINAEGEVVIERMAQPGTLTIGVDAGKHRLRVEKNGVEIFAQEFNIGLGGTETIKASFEPTLAATAAFDQGKEPPRAAVEQTKPHLDTGLHPSKW